MADSAEFSMGLNLKSESIIMNSQLVFQQLILTAKWRSLVHRSNHVDSAKQFLLKEDLMSQANQVWEEDIFNEMFHNDF